MFGGSSENTVFPIFDGQDVLMFLFVLFCAIINIDCDNISSNLCLVHVIKGKCQSHVMVADYLN